jgi:hypothetical protein
MKKYFNSLTKPQQVVVIGFIITGLVTIITTLITNISSIIIKQTDKKRVELIINEYSLNKSNVENKPEEERKSIPNQSITTINEIWQENMQEEWKLFIFAREAFKFKNIKDIVSEYDIYEYSKTLEEKLLFIIRERYNNFDLDIQLIDEFLAMNKPSLEDKDTFILYEKYENIDVRIKYAIYAYGYSQYRIYFGRYFVTERKNIDYILYRCAKAAVFRLDEKDLESLLGLRKAFRLTHDDD